MSFTVILFTLIFGWFSFSYCQKMFYVDEDIPKGYIFKNFEYARHVKLITKRSGLLTIVNRRLVTAKTLDLDTDEDLCNDSVIEGTVLYDDLGEPLNFSFSVTVNRVDEYGLAFPSNETISIPFYELMPKGTRVLVLKGNSRTEAEDKDCGDDKIIHYILNDPSQNFVITDSSSGTIVTNRSLRYSHDNNVSMLTVTAVNLQNLNETATATLKIIINDVDDKDPIFKEDMYILNITEHDSNKIGVWINTDPPIEAFDQDIGINAKLNFSFLESNISWIEINSTGGQLKINKVLDREESASYLLHIQSWQANGKRGTATTTLSIIVTDINDQRPVFSETNYTLKVKEFEEEGTKIFNITAVDLDEGDNAKFAYKIADDSQSAFAINPTTGIITVANSSLLDKKINEQIILQIIAQEQMPRLGPMCDSSCKTVVTINIINITENNFSPVFEKPAYSFSLPEDVKTGTFIGYVKAVDEDIGSNGVISYKIVEKRRPELFSLNNDSGKLVLKMRPPKKQWFTVFTIRATDHGMDPLKTNVPVEVFIGNPNGPVRIDVPFSKELLERNPVWIETELSKIFNVSVAIDQIKISYSHSYGHSSELYISVTNTTKPVSAIEMLRLAHNNSRAIHRVMLKYRRMAAIAAKKLGIFTKPLSVTAGFIFLSGIICIGVICINKSRLHSNKDTDETIEEKITFRTPPKAKAVIYKESRLKPACIIEPDSDRIV